MPKFTKTVVDADLRSRVFDMIQNGETDNFEVINARQQGIILTDLNGVERLVRLGAIVAEEREDMTARQLMAKEQKEYPNKQAEKAEKPEKGKNIKKPFHNLQM